MDVFLIFSFLTRFKNPERKKPWHGVYDANKDGPMCPQLWYDSIDHGNEDCLYLNVYTPKVVNKYRAFDFIR